MLDNNAKISDIISSLQESEGINQKAELRSILIDKGITVDNTEDMASIVSKVNGLVKLDPTCIPTNIRENININGVVGSLKPIPTILAGDNPIFHYDMPDDLNRMSTNSNTYAKILSVKNYIAGTYRIKFRMVSYNGGTVYAKIYKNNQPIGTERSTTSVARITFTEDFALNANDEVELYGHVTNSDNYCNIIEFSINISEVVFFKQL